MKVIPVGQPTPPAETQGLTPSKLDAIKAKLASTMQPRAESPKPQAQEHPVPDANKVAPEDLGGLKVSNTTEEITQPHTNGDAPAAEAPKPAETSQETPLSAQYAQLARQQKAARLEAQKLKAERQALETERQALKTPPPALYDES